MNILYLSADRGIPIRGHKGAAVHVRMLINALHNLGHQVTLLTTRAGDKTGPAPQARLVAVKAKAQHADSEKMAQAHADALFAAALSEVATQNYDFIYERYSLWSDVGARLSQATGLPLVLEVNAPLRHEASQYRQLVAEETAVFIEQRQFQAATQLIAVSAWLADYAADLGVERQRIHVLPNAVDPQQFHPAVRGGRIHQRYGLHDKIVVGFVGRPRPWHDLETLLTAVSALHKTNPRYHLLLVGQMPDDIEQQLAHHNLSDAATVTGPIPHSEVPAHIAAMTVAISPHRALADFYYSPLKLFEYLAVGVPTIAANVGQQGDIIRPNETGYLYPAGNARVLQAYIRKLIDDPETARQIGWQGASHVLQNHTWTQNAQAMIDLVSSGQEAKDKEIKRLRDLAQPLALPQNQSPNLPISQSPLLPILDDKLRQRLYRATRPDLILPFFSKSLPMYGKRGNERLKGVAEIELFKYKPRRRAVLGYRLNGRLRHTHEKSSHEVIGKLFRDDRGRRLCALQAALWENGFGPNAVDEIYVPRALAYIDKMRMLVQAKAPGQTLNELIETTSITPLMSRCAEGLSKLHRSSLVEWLAKNGRFLLKPYTLSNELAQLDTFAANLCNYRPALALEAHHLQRQLIGWSKLLAEPETAVPIHRDFYYSQVLCDGPRLTLIDFDLLALGDPALDVANFTAHLAFMALDHLGDFAALDHEIELFKDSYAWHANIDADFWQRVAFYEAATFFRLLQVIAPRPGMAHLFAPMLEQTQARLAVPA